MNSDKVEFKSSPVSRILSNGGGIESDYLTVPYMPSSSSFELCLASSHFITMMVFADVYRSERALANVERSFKQVLAVCETQQDFDNFKKMTSLVAQKGGYAAEFYTKMENVICPIGKKIAVKMLEKEEKEKEHNANANNHITQSFLSRYREAKEELDRVMNSGVLNDSQISGLLSVYNQLQSDLYGLHDKIDKQSIIGVDIELDNSIEWLRSAYQTLDKDEEVFKSL